MPPKSPPSFRATRALCLAPMTLALAAAVSPRESAAAGLVRVVETVALDWPEGRRAIEAELVAAGYELEAVRSEAPDEATLVRELVVTESGATIASVTVVRAGPSGVAYARFAGSDETYSVASSDPDSSRAAEILSLRLVELLTVRDDERKRAPKPPPARPKRAEPAKAVPPAVPPAPAWFVLGGVGAGWTSGFDAPSAELTVALERRLSARFRLEGRARVAFLAAERSFPRGAVSVAGRSFSAGVFAWFGPDGATAEGPFAAVGPRLGAECYEIQGSGVGATLACAPAGSVAGRVGVALGRWSVGLAAESSFALRQIRLLDGDEPLATLGRPSGNVSLEAGWSF